MAKIRLSAATVLKNVRQGGEPSTYTAPEGTVVEHTSRAAPDDPAVTIHRVQVVRAGETFALERRRPAPGKSPPPKVAPAAPAQPAPRPAAVPPKTAPRVVSAKSLQPTVLTPQEVAVASRAHAEAERRDREELPSEPDPKLAQQEAALARIAAAETERQERLAAHREGLARAAARKADLEASQAQAEHQHNGSCSHAATAPIRQPRTLRNDKSGQTITTLLTDQEAAAQFAQGMGGKESWLWFWLHKWCGEHGPKAPGTVPGTTAEQTRAASSFLGDQFMLAVAYLDEAARLSNRKMRSPMIRAHFCPEGGQPMRLKWYMSRRGTMCLKSGNLTGVKADGSRDPVGDEVYVGCLSRGQFLAGSLYGYGDRQEYSQSSYVQNQPRRPLTATEAEFLRRLEEDPTRFLAQCGRDMGRCCFCNLPLEDPVSKAYGYGKICAGHWGLPYGEKKHQEKTSSFAEVYDKTAAGFMQAIRENPQDEVTWKIFSDWLQEHGLPPVTPPRKGVQLPRND